MYKICFDDKNYSLKLLEVFKQTYLNSLSMKLDLVPLFNSEGTNIYVTSNIIDRTILKNIINISSDYFSSKLFFLVKNIDNYPFTFNFNEEKQKLLCSNGNILEMKNCFFYIYHSNDGYVILVAI
ncbi:MAG: hypothetical protein NZZ41_03090 [Candidatus Dojkabacteria bacterium]|nr:hypothetical protein [Candidatus Dojkabacteria bacterium]